MELLWLTWEGTPAAYLKGSGGIGWVYRDGRWRLDNGPDLPCKATVISREQFVRMFGRLPDPPVVPLR